MSRKLTPPPGFKSKATDPPEDDHDDTAEEDEGDESEGSEEADESDDAEGDDNPEEKKPSPKSLNKAHRDAGKYRVRLRETKRQLDAVRSEFDRFRAEIAFEREAGDRITDHDAAWKLVDLDRITIEDDGTVSGMDDAVGDLIERHPFLLRDDADDEGSKAKPERNPFDAGRSGRPVTGKVKPGHVPDKKKLANKYPALRGRV